MTRAELEQALRQQQAENAALRAELARVTHPPTAAFPEPGTAVPNQEQFALLIRETYPAVVLADTMGVIT